jgi:diaminopimelate epimerase
MSLLIPFAKASGAGNDFVLINNFESRYEVELARLARSLCARHTGIGADGLLVLEKSHKADFKMMYFNADGSYGGMCGNGGRCIALFASLLGIVGDRCRIEALDYVYDAEIRGEGVRLKMKDPVNFRSGLVANAGGNSFQCYAVDTGAPHAVVFTDDLENLDVVHVGRELRSHALFLPDGTNANFVKKVGKNRLEVRTYERGVEAETLACGTGSIASAVVASMVYGMAFPIDIVPRSGEVLRVHSLKDGKKITNVILEGPAAILFSGNVLYDTISEKILAMRSLSK